MTGSFHFPAGVDVAVVRSVHPPSIRGVLLRLQEGDDHHTCENQSNRPSHPRSGRIYIYHASYQNTYPCEFNLCLYRSGTPIQCSASHWEVFCLSEPCASNCFSSCRLCGSIRCVHCQFKYFQIYYQEISFLKHFLYRFTSSSGFCLWC